MDGAWAWMRLGGGSSTELCFPPVVTATRPPPILPGCLPSANDDDDKHETYRDGQYKRWTRPCAVQAPYPIHLHKMIRTHRPRGHAWNCASVFQQTLDFRHIDLEEGEPPTDEILGKDPRDDWTLAERTAKRQRIEKIADDFLNGKQLHIHSARSDPQRFKTALTLSFANPRDARAAVEEAFVRHYSASVAWEDVEDDREVLRASVSSRKRHDADSTTAVEDASVSGEVAIVEAQASCGPKRRLRSGKVMSGPSEEALRKAAELRNRRLRRSGVDTLLESQTQSCPRPVIQETQDLPTESSIEDTASDCGPMPTPAWTSSKWIKSGAFQLPKKSVDEDCSKDELGATSLFTPSQRSRPHTGLLARTTSAQQALPVSCSATNPTDSHTLSDAQIQSATESFRSTALVPETSNPSLAVSQTQEKYSESAGCGPVTANDSQTELLHQQGLYVAPRKSWTAVNDASVTPGRSRQETERKNAPALEASQEHTHAVRKTSKGRVTRSTGSAQAQQPYEMSMRRRSDPVDSQRQANTDITWPIDRRVDALRDRTQYTSVAVGGASPFVFRKRASKSNTNTPEVECVTGAVQQPTKTPRRKMVFPSSDSPDQMAPAPHTPLANEHLNKILPKDPVSERRSSATRKALREELKASGAELSRCADDPSSSQGEDAPGQEQQQDSGDISIHEEERTAETRLMPRERVESQTVWPGTQDQLAQAYKNLFTSPDKTDTSLYLGEKSTPGAGIGHEGSRTARNPLKQLSQEPVPMPSTQALLDGWEGWSTIKKPRSDGKRSSLGQSPTVGKGGRVVSSDPAQSMAAANRRSSLRFSMSTYESPERGESSDINSLPTTRLDLPQLARDALSSAKSATRQSTIGALSSLSFGFSTLDLPTTAPQPNESQPLSKTLDELSFGQTMSSVQQPQRQPEPDYDSQDLDLTITQIADDVLTTGVESVMASGQRSGTFSC